MRFALQIAHKLLNESYAMAELKFGIVLILGWPWIALTCGSKTN